VKKPAEASRSRAFPWDDVIAFCLGEMRLAPREMWAATPIEIAAMVRGRRHVTHGTAMVPPRRDDFAALAALYPDRS
jgi:uncharacterized phage protein (TIGR02216 family)